MNPNIKLDENITDIADRCIGCIEKAQDMYNLNEFSEKKSLFIKCFNIELTAFSECPQFLCYSCDGNLKITFNFQEQVRQSLDILQEHNKALGLHLDHDTKFIKYENYDYEETPDTSVLQESQESFMEPQPNSSKRFQDEEEELIDEEDHHNDHFEPEKYEHASPKTVLKRRFGEVDLVQSELVDGAVAEFKKKISEKKTCLVCGFTSGNRRTMSSHMAMFHKEEKRKWCLECNGLFEDYEVHKSTHINKETCPFCQRKFTTSHYVEHLHSHAGTFECGTCGKQFKSSAWLNTHIRIHANNKPYVCPTCSKGFIQRSSLRYHLATNGQFSCSVCKRHFLTEDEQEQHLCKQVSIKIEGINGNEDTVEEIHLIRDEDPNDVELPAYCKLCHKKVRNLDGHMQKFHAEDENLNCELCQKSFSDNYKLRSHLRTHTGELPYKCRFCDKRLPNRSRLLDHERSHTKEKPYICSFCGKALSQASALRTHMKQHTGRPEVCEICNKRFCRKSELKLHLSKHMGHKPFLCTKCGKSFAQRSHLTEHMVGHGEARPYKCTVEDCGRAFKKNILLKEHLKIHNGEKRFICPTCNYGCYKAYRLQQHMKLHNKDTQLTQTHEDGIFSEPKVDEQ